MEILQTVRKNFSVDVCQILLDRKNVQYKIQE